MLSSHRGPHCGDDFWAYRRQDLSPRTKPDADGRFEMTQPTFEFGQNGERERERDLGQARGRKRTSADPQVSCSMPRGLKS